MSSYEVRAATNLGQLSKQLKQAGNKELQRDMRKRLRAAVMPAVESVRAAALAIPAKGPKSTGLRRSIAAATGAQGAYTEKSAKVTVRTNSRRMPANQQRLPLLMNREEFRHPVYAKDQQPRTWVTQKGHPFFDRSIVPHVPHVQREAEAVMDDVAKRAGFR